MKVLFLGIAYPDYLFSFSLEAMSNVLGKENVIVFPLHEAFSEKENKMPDFLKICHVDFSGQKNYTLDEIIEMENLGEFDYVFINRPYAMDKDYLNKIKEGIKSNFVVLDDDSKVMDNLFQKVRDCLDGRILAYFQKEKVFNEWHTDVFPLQFSVPEDRIDKREYKKEYSVTFIARITNVSFEFRNEIVNILRRMSLSDSFIHWDAQAMPYVDYIDVTRKSLITITAMGERFDCPRFYEIPALSSMILSNRLLIDVYKPFIHDVHAFYFDSFNNLESDIRYLLDNQNIIERITKAGKEHLRDYHTSEKRAEYILKILSSLNGGIEYY